MVFVVIKSQVFEGPVQGCSYGIGDYTYGCNVYYRGNHYFRDVERSKVSVCFDCLRKRCGKLNDNDIVFIGSGYSKCALRSPTKIPLYSSRAPPSTQFVKFEKKMYVNSL